MSAEGKYVPRFLSGSPISPDRSLNSIITRLSPMNYEGLIGAAKSIEVLTEPEREEVTDETADREMMKPIVNTILKSIKNCNESDPQIETFTKMFIDLTGSWKGRQGKILMKQMSEQLDNMIKIYVQKTDIEVKDRLEMYSIVKFIGFLYSMNKVPSIYIIKLLEMFRNAEDEEKLGIFARILSNNIYLLKNDSFFNARFAAKYKTFVLDYLKGENRGLVHHIMNEIILTKWT